MKTTIILIAVLFFDFSFLLAQPEEDIIKQIRQQFKTINDENKSYASEKQIIETEDAGVEQTLTTFFKGKQLMKIEVKFLGDMAESSNHYYYWNNQLFFIYSTNTYHAYNDGNIETTTNENRYYFDKNKLIRWLDSEKKQREKNSDEYKEKEKEWLEQATKFSSKYGK